MSSSKYLEVIFILDYKTFTVMIQQKSGITNDTLELILGLFNEKHLLHLVRFCIYFILFLEIFVTVIVDFIFPWCGRIRAILFFMIDHFINTKSINYQLAFIQTAKYQIKFWLHVLVQNKRIIEIEYSSSYLDVSYLFGIYFYGNIVWLLLRHILYLQFIIIW